MQFLFKKEGLEIKLSWRERLSLFFKGKILFSRYDSYVFNATLLRIVSENSKKYGDSKEHGTIKTENV
jgi:hypothetical protein